MHGVFTDLIIEIIINLTKQNYTNSPLKVKDTKRGKPVTSEPTSPSGTMELLDTHNRGTHNKGSNNRDPHNKDSHNRDTHNRDTHNKGSNNRDPHNKDSHNRDTHGKQVEIQTFFVDQKMDYNNIYEYDTELPNEKELKKKLSSYSMPADIQQDILNEKEETEEKQLRENDYQKQRLNRQLSPERVDAFKRESEGKSYKQVMKEREEEFEKRRERKRQLDQVNVPSGGGRWDQKPGSDWETDEPKSKGRWDQPTPVGQYGETPKGQYGETPKGQYGETPKKKSRWDVSDTPVQQTPTQQTPREQRYMSDEELNQMFPPGYEILEPPANYQPIRTPARKLQQTPMRQDGFAMQEDTKYETPPEIPGVQGLEFFKNEDAQYFGKLMDNKDDMELSIEELKERKVMRLLLKIKNGSPQVRRVALRQITDGARLLGAGPIFNHILPLLMSPTIEEQERHMLVKVIDRVMYKLDDLVRPYCHKILVVIEPMLIDTDYYARIEGREIISNLAKAAGLATMIATMRPDIDHEDEYVRNTTSRAFAVVASALGIPALVPFLKAVCKSKKSWQARHTGTKIVQQIAILLGCAVLPHLKSLVDAIGNGLVDEQPKVRTMTALAISALAEAASPYGIESFQSVLQNLMAGIKQHRGKSLAAFFKAIGFIIPLFDATSANAYTKSIMKHLTAQFETPDEEMKKIVLKVVSQCVSTELDPAFIKNEILPKYFRYFWIRRMALDRRNYKQVVETTAQIAQKVSVSEILGRIIEDLKDESEPFRKMTMETIEEIVKNLGSADIDDRMVEVLLDGVLYAFQEQTAEDDGILNGFGTIVNSLGLRCKQYLPQICSTILWRLNNKSAKVRQQAADLISKIATVMKQCGEEKLMGQLGVVLFEYLGEEYPEVLGSIIKALKSIVNVIGMSSMTPPIKDLLPRMTPILKNRHEKVQEHCIDLVGRIADRGAEFVSAREWMRICFELLDMLHAHKKSIRRAAVNTFGYIAKAIGPQDVLATLLNNLKVQERQNRVCTTVAIAIVAETCSPFTVLPALMNEYRVPELNVQNGCLKALSFLFEYIGEMGKDYIWAVSTLLEDALMDRDLVHRQTACATVKHMALGVVGLGCEDAITHMFNLIWPNIFETSPHVVNAVMDALEGCRVALGPAIILSYCLQGLFHPARRVREMYWKVYNTVYIGSQDALVPYFPKIESDGRNQYERWELEYVI
ncbi:Splicing factor 3B subunit 1 [Boothiomyces macroporosus]|uniref:Splicing factor 3B subunit 1 n=1 Tax=Boothiomyces macroporosus TaxID=261099 RepID=A0AAD5UBS0_9FUNG|nr:Splicing factor 3B subunit 1 [Boothiomyces macroporosus]